MFRVHAIIESLGLTQTVKFTRSMVKSIKFYVEAPFQSIFYTTNRTVIYQKVFLQSQRRVNRQTK